MNAETTTLPCAEGQMLIVDDHGPILRALSARCQHAGLNVHTAKDAGTAIAVALSSKPKYAILDINMPGLSGFELAVRLKELLPDLRFAFLTASQDWSYAQHAMSLGATGLFHKPVDSREVLANLLDEND
ncbi:MAG: response regulator [Pseudomonadota bacterium]